MEGVTTYVKDGVRIIKLVNTERKNALSINSYKKIINILNEDAKRNDTALTVITGSGEYFCSGHDMNHSEDIKTTNVSDSVQFSSALINYPKILIAVVNGPAIGIGVAMLGLCDVIYASDRATFHTPYANLGAPVTSCASYTFPRILGRSNASQMLLLGRKMSAQEALQCRLVSKVVPHDKLNKLFTQLQEYGKLLVNTIRINKKLLNNNIDRKLRECSDRECNALKDILDSEEFVNGFILFMSRRSKL